MSISFAVQGCEEITVEVSETSIEIGSIDVSSGIDVGEFSVGVPYIPSNYGLITYNGSILTVS